jgi:hypothetical protein
MGFGLQAKSIRAIEMKSSDWVELKKLCSEEVVVEFRKGETVPITFNAGGDLLETKHPTVTEFSVKQDFWVRIQNNNFQLSVDGYNFTPFTDLLRGSISLGADDAGNFTAGFDAYLK